MPESKATPGPYEVSRGAQGFPFSIESATKTIAYVKTLGIPAESLGNAKLFAASRDMLTALRGCAKAFADLREQGVIKQPLGMLTEELVALEAITKATE